MIKFFRNNLDEILLVIVGSLCWMVLFHHDTLTPNEVAKRIRDKFPNNPEMEIIIWCESRNHQWNSDGSVYTGEQPSPRVVGAAQINIDVHGPWLARIGLNPYELDDNLEIAAQLRKRDGLAPWYSSGPRRFGGEGCWDISRNGKVYLAMNR